MACPANTYILGGEFDAIGVVFCQLGVSQAAGAGLGHVRPEQR